MDRRSTSEINCSDRERPARRFTCTPGVATADAPYRRARDLPRLLPVWPHEIESGTIEAHRALVQRLQSALRRERQRGLACDWSYDLARHRALLAAWRCERDLLLQRLKDPGSR